MWMDMTDRVKAGAVWKAVGATVWRRGQEWPTNCRDHETAVRVAERLNARAVEDRLLRGER